MRTALAALALVVTAGGAAAQQQMPTISELLTAEVKASRTCEGSGDPDVIREQCRLRDRLSGRLAQAGYCWGRKGQTDEKKAVAIAIANTLGNLSFVYTPYLWPVSSKPRFSMAMWASVGFCAGTIACAWVLKFILMRDNRKIRAQNNEAINFYVY